MVIIKQNIRLSDRIAMVIILLMTIGTVFVFSADVKLQQELSLRNFYNSPGLRQIILFPLACLVIYAFSRFDYHRLRINKSWFKSPVFYLLVISITLLIIVLIPQLGTEVNRARRWLRIPIGPAKVSFQPSELAKWATIFFLAAACDKYRNSLTLYWKRFVSLCLVTALVTALIITQDFGTAAFILLLSFLIFLMAGVKFWYLLTPLPFAGLAFFAAIKYSPERMQRITAFLNPDKWAGDANYQANQSLIALGSGGLWGKGLGRGICKYGHLPEDTTDFIFAIIGEELGFVGTVAVIGLFIVFVWLGILVVLRCKDNFGKVLAGGIVLAIAVQAAINLGVVTVVLPTKGIPLPFVSAGGTSMLISAAAIGILLNIAKQSAEPAIEGIGDGS